MADANVSLQILPVTEENQIYPVVDKVIELIDRSGLPYVVGPMETTIEGNLTQILDIVKKAHELCFDSGIARTLSVVKIDYKPAGVSIDEKICKYRK